MRDLLTLLCHYPYDSSSKERLSELLNKINDWDHLVRLINAHGIIALAAYNITEAGLESLVPANAMSILENGRRQSYVRNLWLTERWKEVNQILSKAGIKHVLLKGMALEHTLYESKGLRQMNDNDILIKHSDAVRAWYLLQENGYNTELPKSALHSKIRFDLGKHLPALYKDGYAVEAHRNLFGNDDPVDSAVSISISNETAWILPPDMQLRHLTEHFNSHTEEGDCQFRLYADIKLLDSSTSIEISNSFVEDPIQSCKKKFRRREYRKNFMSIAPRFRLLFLAGDIFPTLAWMKKRYKCSGAKAFLYYPQRVLKLLWLI